MNDTCGACGQTIKLAHKEQLSKSKLNMLKQAADYVSSNMSNDIPAKVFQDISSYNNFQKLRYHGLIHYYTRDGRPVRGHWLITRNGWSFLRGEIELPKYVLVKNNHITSRSDERVSVRDIFYGDPVMHTTFEYFDEQGKPVGYRPLMPARAEQVRLI